MRFYDDIESKLGSIEQSEELQEACEARIRQLEAALRQEAQKYHNQDRLQQR